MTPNSSRFVAGCFVKHCAWVASLNAKGLRILWLPPQGPLQDSGTNQPPKIHRCQAAWSYDDDFEKTMLEYMEACGH